MKYLQLKYKLETRKAAFMITGESEVNHHQC